MHSLSLSLSPPLSLDLTALEKGEDPHHPASPIHILAVTSTPTLNTGGQSEELGSDGGQHPPPDWGGKFSFQPLVRGQRFQAGIGGILVCPAPPQGSDDTHTLEPPLLKESDCGQPPILLVGGGGRSGRWEGGRPPGNVS